MPVQVYDGSKANCKEEEAGNPVNARPVNAYGTTKLEAEQVIQVAEKIDHLLEASSPYLIARCALPAGVLSWMADRPQNVHYGDDAYWRE